MKPSVRSVAALALIIGLQLGCARVQARPEAEPKPPVVQELVKSSRSWNGDLLPAYPAGQPEITMLRITIPAGTRLKNHSHPVINAGVLLSGQLTVVTADGQTLHLEAGDPIVEVVNTWHYGLNEGTVPAQIVVFYAGTEGGAPLSVAAPN